MVAIMRVLVTGATGRVGRIVVEQLVAAGVQVRGMTRQPAATFPEAVETARRRPAAVTGSLP
jgi:uncharacterized protein YbjT (DUF2867 family)